MEIKIMIADDHLMFREGLKQLLEADGDIEVIGEASDGIECLDLLKNIKPDILLLDINMPRMNGLEALKKIRLNNIKVKVLILTVHSEIEYLIKTVDIGIDGYLLKDSQAAVLKKAIYDIYNGDIYIQPSLTPMLNLKMIDRDIDKMKIELLTKRELEVLKLVAEGMFNRNIAEKLQISERTVKNHISSIFKKIQVADRTQAAVFSIKNNIIKIF